MTRPRYFSCDDIVDAFGLKRYHCESCHEDYDMGQGMCCRTMLLDGNDVREQSLCCDVSRQISDVTDEEFFAKLDAHAPS